MKPLTPDELRVAGFQASKVFDKEKKDLESYILMGRCVFDAANALATQLKDTSPDEAKGYRSIAMNTSFNIAAACWPGWEDAYQDITEEQLSLALEMCRFNVATGRDLDAPPARRLNGYWILGVHLMAAGIHDEAKTCFEAAANCADVEDNEANRKMAAGWITCNEILKRGEKRPDAQLQRTIDELSALGEDGEFYAAQFAPAMKNLRRRRSA